MKTTTQTLSSAVTIIQYSNFYSPTQKKSYQVDVFLPPHYAQNIHQKYAVLYANDGQDMEAVEMAQTLAELYLRQQTQPFIVVAIHANERLQDYGTAFVLDFAKRGNKAKKYAHFLHTELMPYINAHYRTLTAAEHTAFMGFSLGGLSAFDIVWHNRHLYGMVGVFSGSFWWRTRDLSNGYTPNDRIMQAQIRDTPQQAKENLRFWLQTGTLDETNDRDGDGVIDAIGDTLDLVLELNNKGYDAQHIRYVEVVNGYHNHETWKCVLPDFLSWAFQKK
jgi:enterochelin esterase-like enzyme